jgi:hypothetical protein
MRRRDFLRLSVTMPAALASHGVFGQTNNGTRAAVVIGVDRPHDLPPLNAAVSGAKKVADWLRSEKIDVKLIVDDQGPVKAEDIFDAVDEFVKQATLQQLIIYFAGHGTFVGTAEFWLLSNALHNSNQAVSISQCPLYARQCGIPNVVVISDACRSTSTSLNIQTLSGYNIFPTVNNRKVNTFLDMFYATRLGAPAYEVKDTAGTYKGIYTECLLEAYINPDAKMTEEVDKIEVVTNKKLEAYLLSTVPKRAQIFDVNEYPDSIVTSANYIGRAIKVAFQSINSCISVDGRAVCANVPIPASRSTIGDIPVTINNLAEFELSHLGVDLSLSPNVAPASISPSALEEVDKAVGFGANRNLLLNARGPNVFPTGTGINVFGTRLRAVFSTRGIETRRLSEGNGSSEPTVVQIILNGERQASIALELEHGSGTVIAGLEGYVATVVVDSDRVISVSYERATKGELATTPLNGHVAQLRAVVATAANFGVFRIDGPPGIRESNAAKLANTIRVEKSFDPTLGIYAAYAYATAGLENQIRSVYSIMKEEGIELFDVALLADVLEFRVVPRNPPGLYPFTRSDTRVVPFCPMLNQGWQFLAVRNVTVFPSLAEAQAHILPSLWTTFDSEGMSIVKSAL